MKRTYINDRGNGDVRIMIYDSTRDVFLEGRQHATISDAASALFYSEYMAHKPEEFALENARETTADALPDEITGSFDDEHLTFLADCDEEN